MGGEFGSGIGIDGTRAAIAVDVSNVEMSNIDHLSPSGLRTLDSDTSTRHNSASESFKPPAVQLPLISHLVPLVKSREESRLISAREILLRINLRAIRKLDATARRAGTPRAV